MSRTTPSTSEATSTITESAEEEIVWPEFNPSPAHRHFLERLRLARLGRGLSISDMSDEVGLTYRLANEFETLAAPLPFEWLEVWCQTVGVPFDDFLAIYWADEREWEQRQERKQSEQQAPCITITEAGEGETETLAPTSVNRGFGWLSSLRAALSRVARFSRLSFSTSRETSK